MIYLEDNIIHPLKNLAQVLNVSLLLSEQVWFHTGILENNCLTTFDIYKVGKQLDGINGWADGVIDRQTGGQTNEKKKTE